MENCMSEWQPTVCPETDPVLGGSNRTGGLNHLPHRWLWRMKEGSRFVAPPPKQHHPECWDLDCDAEVLWWHKTWLSAFAYRNICWGFAVRLSLRFLRFPFQTSRWSSVGVSFDLTKRQQHLLFSSRRTRAELQHLLVSGDVFPLLSTRWHCSKVNGWTWCLFIFWVLDKNKTKNKGPLNIHLFIHGFRTQVAYLHRG